jgi:hypothetical protein
MKLTIAIIACLAIVGFICYKIGYRTAVRDDIAIRARNDCISNLRRIDGAKVQAASDLGLKDGAMMTTQTLATYKSWPYQCPAEGSYTIGPVGKDPTCSIPGHTLLP